MKSYLQFSRSFSSKFTYRLGAPAGDAGPGTPSPTIFELEENVETLEKSGDLDSPELAKAKEALLARYAQEAKRHRISVEEYAEIRDQQARALETIATRKVEQLNRDLKANIAQRVALEEAQREFQQNPNDHYVESPKYARAVIEHHQYPSKVAGLQKEMDQLVEQISAYQSDTESSEIVALDSIKSLRDVATEKLRAFVTENPVPKPQEGETDEMVKLRADYAPQFAEVELALTWLESDNFYAQEPELQLGQISYGLRRVANFMFNAPALHQIHQELHGERRPFEPRKANFDEIQALLSQETEIMFALNSMPDDSAEDLDLIAKQ